MKKFNPILFKINMAELSNKKDFNQVCGWAKHIQSETPAPSSEILKLLKENSVYGEFSGIHWNSKTEQLTLFRDPLGIIPLYYSVINQQIIIATSISQLAEQIDIKKGNTEYFKRVENLDFSDKQHTLLQNVFRVPNGCLLTIQLPSLQTETKSYVDTERAFEQIPKQSYLELTKSALKNRYISQEHTSLFLSGGVDSSILAKLAHDNKIKLSAHSLIFRTGEEANSSALENLKTLDSHSFQFKEMDEQTYMELSPKKLFNPFVYYSPGLMIYNTLLKNMPKGSNIWTGLGGDDVFTPDYKVYYKKISYWRLIKTDGFNYALKKAFYSLPILLQHLVIKFLNPINTKMPVNKKLLPFKTKNNHRNHYLLYRFFSSGTYQFGLENEQELAQTHNCFFSYPLLDYRLFLKVLNDPHLVEKNSWLEKPIIYKLAKDIGLKNHFLNHEDHSYTDYFSNCVTRFSNTEKEVDIDQYNSKVFKDNFSNHFN